jgi:hypothetical protein
VKRCNLRSPRAARRSGGEELRVGGIFAKEMTVHPGALRAPILPTTCFARGGRENENEAGENDITASI